MTTLTANRINFKEPGSSLYKAIITTTVIDTYDNSTDDYNDNYTVPFSVSDTGNSVENALENAVSALEDYLTDHIDADPTIHVSTNFTASTQYWSGHGTSPVTGEDDAVDIDARCTVTIVEPAADNWNNLLDMLHPIGSIILWSDNNVRPAERYGGQWTLLSSDSAYKGQFLAITNGAAATGGADISSVKWTPSGKSSNVTVTPGMCNIASGTTMYTIPAFSSAHSYTHSHTFPNNAKVAKSVSIATTLATTLNFGSSGTQNYYAMAVYNKNTMNHNHQGMHSGWMATWINYHSHSFPSITAANAATAHSHTFTGSTSSINFTPAGYSLQLWRRDA